MHGTATLLHMKTTSLRDLIRRFIPPTLAALVLAAFGNLAPPLWAKPRPPLPPMPERCLLFLRFNETNWWGNLHPPPLVFDNIQLAESWSAYSLDMSGKQASRLQYPLVRTEAATATTRTNLNLATGSVRFWFRPDWSSAALGGDGPGVFGRLVEVGAWTEDARAGWWSLFFSEDGNAIHFSAQAHGKQINYLDASIQWLGAPGAWHLIVLTYGAKASELYVDGALVAKGDGMTLWPDANGATARGFSIGSDLKGEHAAGGQFEEWTSFGYALSAEEIAHYYSNTRPRADLGAITPEEDQAQLAYLAALRELAAQRAGSESMLTDSPPPPPGGGGGGGGGTNGPPYSGAAYSGTEFHLKVPVWQGSNVSLTVAGGTNGQSGDLFATTNLVGNTIPESTWTWLRSVATGGTYVLSNQPWPQRFYVLGTTQDSDHDGTNDCWEQLILHTDPFEGLPPFEVFITQPNNGSLLP